MVKTKFIFIFLLFFSITQTARATLSEKVGGYLSGSASVGQFGSSSAGLDDRFLMVGGVDGLLGFNYREVTWGLHASYDFSGQLTPISQAGNTNSKGSMYMVGIGARYFIREDLYAAALLDLMGEYTFLEKTIESESDKMNQPVSLRLKIGKRLNYFSDLVTLDGDLRYAQFNNFHIGGRDYSWTSQLWSVGVALTWHFGKAAPYVPEVEPVAAVSAETAKVVAPVVAESSAQSIRIKSKYVFSANHYRVNGKMVTELKEIAKKIKDQSGAVVEVLGFSDTSGDEKFNKALSQYRANSVRDYLIKLQVDPRQITATGMSDQEPVSSNETKEGRAENRRYEVIIKNEENK